MLAEVRKCAENNDIKGLRYIFLDSLDVDPTFEKYREDYEYCRNMEGFFDVYRDLTELFEDNSRWTLAYWEQLKMDLMKNFSEKRFNHMIRVAQVIYAEKIVRLVREREEKQEVKEKVNQNVGFVPQKHVVVDNMKPIGTVAEGTGAISNAELQQQRIEEKRKALEEESRRIEARQRAQRERIEEAKRAEDLKKNVQVGGGGLKKVWGIAFIVAIVVVVILVVAVLR